MYGWRMLQEVSIPYHKSHSEFVYIQLNHSAQSYFYSSKYIISRQFINEVCLEINKLIIAPVFNWNGKIQRKVTIKK